MVHFTDRPNDVEEVRRKLVEFSENVVGMVIDRVELVEGSFTVYIYGLIVDALFWVGGKALGAAVSYGTTKALTIVCESSTKTSVESHDAILKNVPASIHNESDSFVVSPDALRTVVGWNNVLSEQIPNYKSFTFMEEKGGSARQITLYKVADAEQGERLAGFASAHDRANECIESVKNVIR
jgi:hypothetical protein